MCIRDSGNTVANLGVSRIQTLTNSPVDEDRGVAIVEGRPIATTGQLAEVVARCAPGKERVKTLARVFQALSIEVGFLFVVVFFVSESLLGFAWHERPAFLGGFGI